MHINGRQPESGPLSYRFEPAYLALYHSGELARRVHQAVGWLSHCRLCPRECGADRSAHQIGGNNAFCRSGRYAVVSSYFPHFGEEDCISGSEGSGAIFFAWCTLRCVFCQNADISQGGQGMETTPDLLAAMMLDLQTAGCHNINLVSPGHVVPQILEALLLAIEAGLRLPLVYNTSAYDSLYCLGLLDGVVDIYMPDFKFWDPHLALRYLKASNYPRVAKQAIAEMYRQVGDLRCDEAGLAQRGLLLRHLVMPGYLADTERILHFVVEEISSDTYLNLMDQYHPCNRVDMTHYLEIGRELGKDEFMQALKLAHDVGLWQIERNSHWKALRRG